MFLWLDCNWFNVSFPFVDLKKSSVRVIDLPMCKHALSMKQRSELESVVLACHATTSEAYEIVLIYFDNVIHKSLPLKGLRPYDMGRVTMPCMGWSCHPAFVATNDMVDILPTNGVMGGDLKATIEDLQAINARLGCCYNELHNVFFCFLVKLCFFG